MAPATILTLGFGRGCDCSCALHPVLYNIENLLNLVQPTPDANSWTSVVSTSPQSIIAQIVDWRAELGVDRRC